MLKGFSGNPEGIRSDIEIMVAADFSCCVLSCDFFSYNSKNELVHDMNIKISLTTVLLRVACWGPLNTSSFCGYLL